MTIEIETLEAAALDPRARQHMAPMRDGVELATDVYLPDGQGPWPAVLVRLPYDKNGRYCWMPFIARHFTERGYAFLPQDVRGKFRSGGEVNAFVHEVDDGYDTIQWITEQAWSNGDVGMWGDSYYGYTQWAAIASGHPALKAIVPRVTVADLFGWLDGDGVAPLYGAHYLAQYWSDGRTHHWTPDWARRPKLNVSKFIGPRVASRRSSVCQSTST
jgi:putative CocE/NonD family hydrolase